MKNLPFVVFFFAFLFFASPSFAVTLTINSYPDTITENTFSLTASISGATAGTNYLRVDIFKDGTQNYFGETFNNSDWYGGSTYSQYLPVSIQSGVTWGGSLEGRIGSPTSTQYDGTGTYKLRLRRYTSGGGSTASEANNSAVNVNIVVPTSTPIPTDTPPTPVPSATPKPPTSAPVSISSPTATNTPTPSQLTTLSEEEEASESADEDVLGDLTVVGNNPTPTLSKIKTVQTKGVAGHAIPFIFFGSAAIVCAILTFYLKNKNIWKKIPFWQQV